MTHTIPLDQIDPVPEPKTRRKRANGKELATVSEAPAPAPVSQGDAFAALFERLARDPTIDPARIQQFLVMKREEEDRSARGAFLAAFAKLQADLPAVERKGKGHNDKKYARFEDFVQAIRPHLATHGFSLSFRIENKDAMRITGVLGHEAGHEERTDLVLPADTTGNKNPVQSWGSTIQYGKRYVGMALLGTATEDEDDDGKATGAGETITDAQCSTILDKIGETGSDAERFCKFFKIDGVAKLPAAKFEHAMSLLSQKASK